MQLCLCTPRPLLLVVSVPAHLSSRRSRDTVSDLRLDRWAGTETILLAGVRYESYQNPRLLYSLYPMYTAVQETHPPEIEYDFVEEPLQDIFCPVTFEVLRDPHQTTCCGNHISATAGARLQREGKPCPMCKEPNFMTHADKYYKRVVNSLKVRCPHKGRGCEWIGNLGDLDQHANVCPKRPWRCQYCDFTAAYSVGANEHLPQCPKFPEPCPNRCEVGTVQRCDLESHLATECPLQLVACEFSRAGCTEKVPRKDLARHMEGNMQKHLLSMSLLNLSLTRELHEKMDEKDRQIAELQLQLEQLDGNVKRQSQQLDGKVDQKLQQLDGRVEQKFQQLNGRVELEFQLQDEKVKQQFQDLVGSVHTEEFTIREFSQWRQEKKGNWYSEPFYSFAQGYKFQFNIDFDTHHMRIYLYLHKGEHDDTLSWPITCICNVWIMNQERGKKHIAKSSRWEWNSTTSENYRHISDIHYSTLGMRTHLKGDSLHCKLRIFVKHI